MKNIILNELVQKKGHVVNFLCLVTKQFIYSQRCLKRSLNFPALKALYRHIRNVEKFIAVKNNRVAIHAKKWHAHI